MKKSSMEQTTLEDEIARILQIEIAREFLREKFPDITKEDEELYLSKCEDNPIDAVTLYGIVKAKENMNAV